MIFEKKSLNKFKMKLKVSELRILNTSNQNNHEELEQQGRRLCLRINSVLTKTKESISDSVIDRAHRMGSRYLEASSNDYCKSLIIRFTKFRHRTMFCRAKNKLKRGMEIKFDLTKSRYDLLKRANDHVKEVPSIKFCYADINSRLKIKFNDENQKDIFFSSFDDFRDIVDMDIQPSLSIYLFLFFLAFVFVLSLGV